MKNIIKKLIISTFVFSLLFSLSSADGTYLAAAEEGGLVYTYHNKLPEARNVTARILK